MTVILPPDVIDYIFSFLQTDFAALRNCSNAHYFLASLAQRHLYVYIALQNSPTWNDQKFLPSEILKLFAEKPEILNNVVQGLSIDLIPLKRADMDRSLEDISSILSVVLPKLRSITLKGRSPVAWRKLNETFQTAFLNSIRSPSVTEVSIQGIVGFRLSELLGCKGLERLFLRGRFRQSTDGFTLLQMVLGTPVPQLEFLSLYNFSPILNLVHWTPFQKISVLDFHVSKEDDFFALQKLLNCCTFSLICLRIDLSRVDSLGRSSYNPDDGDQINLFPLRLPSGLINLKRVTVHGVSSIKPSSRLYLSTLPDIVRCLDPVPCLEQLTLRLHFEVEDSFFFHTIDTMCIKGTLAYPYPPHVKLHISAANAHGMISPLDILSVLERDMDLMEMVNQGSLFFTAESHFCKHLSCCA